MTKTEILALAERLEWVASPVTSEAATILRKLAARETMPALPPHFTQLIDGTLVYTAEQMRAYGQAFRAAPPQSVEPVAVIHCPEKRKPEGCSLHNLQCGWPACNTPRPPRDTPTAPTDAAMFAQSAKE